MPKIIYDRLRINDTDMAVIAATNKILDEYRRLRINMTLRQVYYQFVQGDLFPTTWHRDPNGSFNNQKNYKKLGEVIGRGRMAGLIDWDDINDITRELRKRGEWENPQELLDITAQAFRLDLWADQDVRPEVWIEKDAMLGNFSAVCNANSVAYFSCRGYTSLSELWESAQRLVRYVVAGQRPVILHFGDHDPSGIDMTRDIFDRVFHFMGVDLMRDHGWKKGDIADVDSVVEVRRLALHMEQVKKYRPPPNPAKLTDPRAKKYVEQYGDDSWELDALKPTVLKTLVEEELEKFRDVDRWNARLEVEQAHRRDLGLITKHYPLLTKQAVEAEAREKARKKDKK